jgi:hypothetical protein
MATQGKGDPNFEIQNYLQFKPLSVFRTSNTEVDVLIQSWKLALDDMKKALTEDKKGARLSEQSISQVKEISLPNNNLFNLFIVPLSIKRIGNNFVQMLPGSK